MPLPMFSRALRGASISAAAVTVATLATPASAQVVTALDLLPRLVSLEGETSVLDATVDLLRTDTTNNTNALNAQVGVLSGLRTDLGTLGSRLGVASTDVADLKVQIGDLRGVLDALPDLGGPGGSPRDLASVIEVLNQRNTTNTTNVTVLRTDVTNIRNSDTTQNARLDQHAQEILTTQAALRSRESQLDDHEKRIGQYKSALGELQSQMANGFSAMTDQMRDHDRRIDKATQGVAMAFAMKSPAVPEDKNFAISGSFGAYQDKTALAFAGGVRATNALQFDAGIAVGLDEGTLGGRAGATLAW